MLGQDFWGYTPAITADGSNINISAIGQNGGIEFYWGNLSTWHAETVAGANTTLTAPSIAVNGGTVTIAAPVSRISALLPRRHRHGHLGPRVRGRPEHHLFCAVDHVRRPCRYRRHHRRQPGGPA